MTTAELLTLLETHAGKSLLFEYRPNAYVGANYHITEVKNVTVDAVDCGAGTDFWKETVIQLYESPEEIGKTTFMLAGKALDILMRVDRIKPMQRGVTVKWEYSNAHFHTAQLFVNDFSVGQDQLILRLGVEKTDCKAKESCAPQPLENVVDGGSTCAPGSGCC